MTELHEMSATELGATLRAGAASPREAVEMALTRIEQEDPELGAFTDVRAEEALAAADALERTGEDRLFAGVPTAIKAATPAAGLVMDYGSRLLAGHRASHDAFLRKCRRQHQSVPLIGRFGEGRSQLWISDIEVVSG